MTDTKANRLLLLNGLSTTYIIFNPLPNPLQCCPMLGVEAHVIHNFELPKTHFRWRQGCKNMDLNYFLQHCRWTQKWANTRNRRGNKEWDDIGGGEGKVSRMRDCVLNYTIQIRYETSTKPKLWEGNKLMQFYPV